MRERELLLLVEFHPEVELYGPYAIVPAALHCAGNIRPNKP